MAMESVVIAQIRRSKVPAGVRHQTPATVFECVNIENGYIQAQHQKG